MYSAGPRVSAKINQVQSFAFPNIASEKIILAFCRSEGQKEYLYFIVYPISIKKFSDIA